MTREQNEISQGTLQHNFNQPTNSNQSEPSNWTREQSENRRDAFDRTHDQSQQQSGDKEYSNRPNNTFDWGYNRSNSIDDESVIGLNHRDSTEEKDETLPPAIG